MDSSPPVPKPRTLMTQNDQTKKPVPLPRTKVQQTATSDKVTATDLLRSIGTASKQLGDEVAGKVQRSAKSANEKIEKSISDGTRFAKGSLERTMSSSRQVRDSLARSVVEGTKTAGLKLRSSTKRLWESDNKKTANSPRCTSMPPAVDVGLFDNIQFHSPLLEQKKYSKDNENQTNPGDAILPMNLSSVLFDDQSVFSSYSDKNTDSLSNTSYDSREHDRSSLSNETDASPTTYDTPTKPFKVALRNAPQPPELPERTSKSERFSFLRQNSLYENWNLPGDPLLPSSSPQLSRPSQSTIYEFDPLKSVEFKLDGKSNELLLLESFLNGDTYGTLTENRAADSDESLNEAIISDPPTPPERFDSLPTLQQSTEGNDASKKETSTSWFTSDEASTSTHVDTRGKSPANNSVMKRFSNILKFDTINKSGKKAEKVGHVERPAITHMPAVVHCGLLTRIMHGAMDELFKNCQVRYCVLSDQKLLCYADPTSTDLKESFPLLSVYSVQVVLPLSVSTAENCYCFEVNVDGGGSKPTVRKLMFSCNSAPERRTWVQKFVEHLTDGFPVKYSSELTRFGLCYIREGVGAQWCGAWMMLIRRILVYYTNKDKHIKIVDLRKTICVVTQEPDEVTNLTCATDGSPNLLLDNPGLTLYLRFPHERELKLWRYMVKLAAHNNGNYIHHQQLTKEDVPTIVDKCINFVYVHGSMSEGIYRRAGASAAVSELLTKFRKDAWSVQLSKASHSEHDVSTALKRFFRDLPEPLIPQELHDRLAEASKITDSSERCIEYFSILQDLPSVAQQSARKLFAHLHFVHSLSETNKMNAENLAAVWAPTIMPTAMVNPTLQMVWSAKEVNVVRDLISLYPAVFKPSNVELERERTMLAVLHRVATSSAPGPQHLKSAGDIRIWVYLNEYAEGKCKNIALTPSKTCEDICVELSTTMAKEPHNLMLEEYICGGSMHRIIPYHELPLDVVLRWGYWDDDDRKDNYLIVKENKPLQEMDAMRGSTLHVCGELRFANEKSKTFKQHMFEIKSSKLTYFKDKQGSSAMGEWEVKDQLWYIGYEPKRNPHSRWAITFIPRHNKSKRCKERAWFGCTIAGTVSEDQLRWVSAITFGQSLGSLLLTPRLIIT